MDSKECPLCSELLIEGAHCSACDCDLHYHRAGITEGGYRKLGERRLTWRCQKCKQTGQRSLQTDALTTAPTSPAADYQPSTSILLAEIKSLSIKLAPLEQLQKDVKALREELTTRVTKIEDRLTLIENDKNDQVVLIHDKLDKIDIETREKEQWSRMNNVEIRGVKQTKTENLFDVLFTIGSKVNYPIQKSSINFVTRVPSRSSDNIKPIIVCFGSRYVKEDFVAAARAKSKECPLTATSLGLGTSGHVYVNDHLISYNKGLLAKAKKAKAELGFTYLWVKHCKIFMRRHDASPIICIKTEQDISKLQKPV